MSRIVISLVLSDDMRTALDEVKMMADVADMAEAARADAERRRDEALRDPETRPRTRRPATNYYD